MRHTEDPGGPKEDPATEKPKEKPKPLSWRPWGRSWKRLVKLIADVRNWDSMNVWYRHNLFFQMMMPLLAYAATFSEQLHFERIYFFTVSPSSEQLGFKSKYLDSTVTFFK